MDFKDQIRRQLTFIVNSCRQYDQGCVYEAVRIATALRVLFYDSGSCESLLSHLGSPLVRLLSTATPFVEEPPLPNLYLVELCTDLVNPKKPSCHCRPALNTALRHEMILFNNWWRECIIEHKEPATMMSRKDLVLAAANKDGGAHVDKALNPVYDYVTHGSGLELEFIFKPETGLSPLTIPFKNIHYASLRQIGYEVLNSPDLAALGTP